MIFQASRPVFIRVELPPENTIAHSVVTGEAQASRLTWPDTFRGLAIVAVVAIHVSSSLMQAAEPASKAWLYSAVLSRVLQFAAPSFIMLSALFLARSLLHKSSLGSYTRNRLQTLLWPFLLWSILYVPYVHSLHPKDSWQSAAWRVFSGEEDYHLYFLRVLLQLAVLLPFLMPLVRRRTPFWVMMMISAAVTLGFFTVNRLHFGIYNVASYIVWYVPSVIMGLWLAGQSERWAEIARKGCRSALAVASVALAVYLPLALQNSTGENVRSIFYPISWWFYTASAGFLLWCLAVRLGEKRILPRGISSVGRYSLQVYLFHPTVLLWLERPTLETGVSPENFTQLLVMRIAIALLASLALAWIAERTRFSALLFGR